MNKREAGYQVLLAAMTLPVIAGGPYSSTDFRIPRFKGRGGTTVRCRACGQSGVTLYRDSDGRICKDCKSKMIGDDGYDD